MRQVTQILASKDLSIGILCYAYQLPLTRFQTLRGHHGSALSHITSGVKILSEVRTSEDGIATHRSLTVSKNPYVGLANLEVLFNRLNTQVAQVGSLKSQPSAKPRPLLAYLAYLLICPQLIGCAPMTLTERDQQEVPGFGPEIPAIYSSLEEARNGLEWHWTSCIQYLNHFDYEPELESRQEVLEQHPMDDERLKHRDTMERWLKSFHAFLKQKGRALSPKNLRAARTLEISQRFATIFLDMREPDSLDDERVWDDFEDRMDEINILASLIVKSTCFDPMTQKRGPDFSLDMNIIAPLFAVAHRCRNPGIRRQAVSTLYTAPRQEGIWDSILTARVAERLIHIEEEGLGMIRCAQDVPGSARISNLSVKFDLQGRVGWITYCRRKRAHHDGEGPVVEEITW